MNGDADVARLALSHEFIRYQAVAHAFKTHLAAGLPAGLDPAAARLLAWLVAKGPSRQGELAEYTFLDPSTVSRRISQLVAQGLVERQVDSVDGRAVQLVPTVLGKALFDVVQGRQEELMQAVLADWSDADLSQLGSLLRRFNDNFETKRSDFNF
jgi:DNA-binding MarR family transcriptional regulator